MLVSGLCYTVSKLKLGHLVRWLRQRDTPVAGGAEHVPSHDSAADNPRTDAFNRAAEAHWRALRAEPSAVRGVLAKPFSGVAFAPSALYRLGLVLCELHVGLGHTVVDFGAGSCWLSLCLNKLGCRTVSIDVSATALGLGQEQFRRDPQARPELEPRFLTFDGHELPLAAASVDRLVCFDAFHHVPNPREVLKEFARVLRPGGRVVMAEPGEGHSHSELSEFEMDRFGVYEGELDISALEAQALAAGFSSMQLKPYPDPAAMSVGAKEYLRLLSGEDGLLPMSALRSSLRQFLVIVLAKGEAPLDSRRPGRLSAEISRVDDVPLAGAGGAIVPLRLSIRNAGDTLWLNEVDPAGGHVSVGGDLIDKGGRLVVPRFFSRPIPKPVAPGESLLVECELALPPDPGSYQVRVDLVDEHVMWFAQAGSQRLSVPLTVAPPVDPAWAQAYLARIDVLGSSPLTALPSTRVVVRVRLENVGRAAWPHSSVPAPEAVSLAAHLFEASGEAHTRELLHVALPSAVEPGQTVEMQAEFEAPSEPGRYLLHLDLVMELRFWFEQRGSAPVRVPLEVVPGIPDTANPGRLRALLAAAGVESARLLLPRQGPLSFTVKATNVGNTRWLHAHGRGAVSLVVHALDSEHRRLKPELHRVPLAHDVAPQESVELRVELAPPPGPRPLALELDLAVEGGDFFSERGSPPLVLRASEAE